MTPEMALKKAAASTQEAVFARLATLDEQTQKKIAKKYYGGNRPWKSVKVRTDKS